METTNKNTLGSRKWRAANPDGNKRHAATYRQKNRERLREKQAAYAAANRDKEIARASKWQTENAEKIRERVADAQERKAGRPRPDVCEVCEEKSDRKLAFDHCHTNGHFRGWLCHRCNLALGLMRDSPTLLQKLSDYVVADWMNQPNETP